MLAQAEKPTNDFFALARYLVAGRERPTIPDRVAWVLGYNLPDADPETAARLMTATASGSRRCKDACYHMMIAWHERERPTPDVMQEIAVKTLHMAGLADHQALIMGHGDKPHPHLHIMLNRVSPLDGRAWKTSHDYRLWDRIMRDLSDEYGFEHVPAHVFNPELADSLPKKPNKRAARAAKRGAKTHRTQWSRRQSWTFADRLSERLDQASTWDDLEMLFADKGLTLEAKGKGHVVGNAAGYTKLSALGLQKTAKGFQKRPAFKRASPGRRSGNTQSRRSNFVMDAVAFARSLVNMGLADRSAIRAAVAEAQGQRALWVARLPLIQQLLADLKRQLSGSTAHTQRRRPHASSKKKKPTHRRIARHR